MDFDYHEVGRRAKAPNERRQPLNPHL